MPVLKNLRIKTTIDKSVQYQILSFCFFKDIEITKSDLIMLMMLAKSPDVELTVFCKVLEQEEIYKSAQSARNSISRCEKKSLIIKKGDGKKTISLNPDMSIAFSDKIALDYKVLGDEPKES